MRRVRSTDITATASIPNSVHRRSGSNESPSELSLSQEQIWLDDQINPGTAVYNIPSHSTLRGRWTQTSWSAA